MTPDHQALSQGDGEPQPGRQETVFFSWLPSAWLYNLRRFIPRVSSEDTSQSPPQGCGGGVGGKQG